MFQNQIFQNFSYKKCFGALYWVIIPKEGRDEKLLSRFLSNQFMSCNLGKRFTQTFNFILQRNLYSKSNKGYFFCKTNWNQTSYMVSLDSWESFLCTPSRNFKNRLTGNTDYAPFFYKVTKIFLSLDTPINF